jgi:hypothetical protein
MFNTLHLQHEKSLEVTNPLFTTKAKTMKKLKIVGFFGPIKKLRRKPSAILQCGQRSNSRVTAHVC